MRIRKPGAWSRAGCSCAGSVRPARSPSRPGSWIWSRPRRPNSLRGFRIFPWPRPWSACFTGGSPRNCRNASPRRILGLITASWSGRWLEGEISGILIFERIGPPISNVSVRCRMARWSKPAESGNLPSFTALRWHRRRR